MEGGRGRRVWKEGVEGGCVGRMGEWVGYQGVSYCPPFLGRCYLGESHRQSGRGLGCDPFIYPPSKEGVEGGHVRRVWKEGVEGGCGRRAWKKGV